MKRIPWIGVRGCGLGFGSPLLHPAILAGERLPAAHLGAAGGPSVAVFSKVGVGFFERSKIGGAGSAISSPGITTGSASDREGCVPQAGINEDNRSASRLARNGTGDAAEFFSMDRLQEFG